MGVGLSVITIPSGKDPDELIRQDVKIWEDIITKPQYAVDWLIDRYVQQLDLTTAMGKRELSDVVLQVVRQLPDSVEQDHYIGKLAELLSVNKQALNTKLATVEDTTQPVRRRVVQPPNHEPLDKELIERQRSEENLMAITFLQPKLRPYLYSLNPDMFLNEQAKKVFQFLQEHADYDGTDKEAVQKFAEYAKILSLVYETLYQDLDLVELGYEAARLQAKLVAQYVRTEKQQLIAQLQDAEQHESDRLMQRVAELDDLLRLNQGGNLSGS